MMPLKLSNPYWDALRADTGIPADATSVHWPAVGPARVLPAFREFCAFRYAMTISDPATIGFITAYASGRVIDPLAGTGYWAYLLQQMGVDVIASDIHPPERTWTHVEVADAAAAVAGMSDRTLLLSWPPHRRPAGTRVLRAFPGSRVIYLGEDFGGCCGTAAMFDLLRDEWGEVAEHTPIQWPGSHDYVTVFDRRHQTDADSPRPSVSRLLRENDRPAAERTSTVLHDSAATHGTSRNGRLDPR
jgi:hypothetical protein